MKRDEFNMLADRAQADHPRWFQLERDSPATEAEISAAERALGVAFPDEYRAILLDHGGGYFAFCFVFGVDAASEWFVVFRNRDRPVDFLGISDPGTGDIYGFRVMSDRRCSRDVVLLDHELGVVTSTPYADFFEWMAALALHP